MLKPHRNWRQYTTPDFPSMISIVYLNSFGFFFFGFLIRFAADKLMQVTSTEMGFIFASSTFGGLITTPLVAYLTDRVSKKKLILGGASGRALSYLVLYIGVGINSVILLTLGIFILGFSVGFFWTPLNVLISQKSHKSVRSSAFGQQTGAIGKGNFIGSVLTIIYFWIIIQFYPDIAWIIYVPLLIYAGLNIYGGIYLYRTVDESITFDSYLAHADTPEIQQIRDQLNADEKSIQNDSLENIPIIAEPMSSIGSITESSKSKQSEDLSSTSDRVPPRQITFIGGMIFFLFAFFVASMNKSMVYPFLQKFLTDTFFPQQPNLEVAMFVMLIYFPSETLAQLIGPKFGQLADRINPVYGIVVISLLGALNTFIVINIHSVFVFSLVLLSDSSIAWSGGLLLDNIASRISKTSRGKIFGFREWMGLLGAILGPILGGIVMDHFGLKAPFILSIFVELSIIPLYLLAIKFLQKHMAEKL